MKRVAVIGSGIAGLAAAWQLSAPGSDTAATLFEAGSHYGGHANTLDLTLDGIRHGVDTGFLVYNERTYPELIRLFGELRVDCAASEMTFSVQAPGTDGRTGLEWSGSSLNTVFAQRSNLLRPRFWQMLADIVRFNRIATALAESGDAAKLAQPVADFLNSHSLGDSFRDDYLLPMIGCIWSCPTDQMLRFPIATLIRFCHNHGLLQVSQRPQWFTVRGGSREYVHKMLPRLSDARLNTPVRAVKRLGPSVRIQADAGGEHFDAVVFACHPDQALALLGVDASVAERKLLGAIRYQQNTAVLHTDASVLPKRQAAWAAWNYERGASPAHGSSQVCLHYLLNRLQPLPWQQPVLVSLNPIRTIDETKVHARIEYAHPVFDQKAISAQAQLAALQGQQRSWFCGAWCGYGFHEDGLKSGLAAARSVSHRLNAAGSVDLARAA